MSTTSKEADSVPVVAWADDDDLLEERLEFYGKGAAFMKPGLRYDVALVRQSDHLSAIAALQARVAELIEHQRQSMHDPDVCNGVMRGEPPLYTPMCVALRTRIAELEARQVTEAMITAYLEANDAYWIATDEMPRPPGKWRTGTPREATRAGLTAVLAAMQKGAP